MSINIASCRATATARIATYNMATYTFLKATIRHHDPRRGDVVDGGVIRYHRTYVLS